MFTHTFRGTRIFRRPIALFLLLVLLSLGVKAQQSDSQPQDEDFAKSVKEWTTRPEFISPLVDHQICNMSIW